jgi:hypothetical protein
MQICQIYSFAETDDTLAVTVEKCSTTIKLH